MLFHVELEQVSNIGLCFIVVFVFRFLVSEAVIRRQGVSRFRVLALLRLTCLPWNPFQFTYISSSKCDLVLLTVGYLLLYQINIVLCRCSLAGLTNKERLSGKLPSMSCVTIRLVRLLIIMFNLSLFTFLILVWQFYVGVCCLLTAFC